MDYAAAVTYERTQSSPQWVVAATTLFSIAMLSLSVYLLASGDASLALPLFMIVWISFIYLAVLNFTMLTVTVTTSSIHLRWRLGWPNKTIDRATIVTADSHRNSWLAGWGIRKVRRGWMWNVWGLDAVQLELDTGRIFRIGTDDVSRLLQALARA